MILLEDPTPIIFCGIVVTAVLGIILVRTGRGIFLYALIGTVAVTLAGVGIEHLVVTEAERVEAALYDTADAIEANDLDAILACCSISAERTRSEAKRALNYAEFIDVKITSLEVEEINYLGGLPTTSVRFTAVVEARGKGGEFAGRYKRPIGFTLQMRKENDRWLILGHELNGAPGGF